MKLSMTIAAAALTLSAGSALAADPYATAAATPTTTVTIPATAPTAAVSGYAGYYSTGYLFPDDGSPSSDQPMARVTVPPQGPGLLSRIYLFPPSEGSDNGSNGNGG